MKLAGRIRLIACAIAIAVVAAAVRADQTDWARTALQSARQQLQAAEANADRARLNAEAAIAEQRRLGQRTRNSASSYESMRELLDDPRILTQAEDDDRAATQAVNQRNTELQTARQRLTDASAALERIRANRPEAEALTDPAYQAVLLERNSAQQEVARLEDQSRQAALAQQAAQQRLRDLQVTYAAGIQHTDITLQESFVTELELTRASHEADLALRQYRWASDDRSRAQRSVDAAARELQIAADNQRSQDQAIRGLERQVDRGRSESTAEDDRDRDRRQREENFLRGRITELQTRIDTERRRSVEQSRQRGQTEAPPLSLRPQQLRSSPSQPDRIESRPQREVSDPRDSTRRSQDDASRREQEIIRENRGDTSIRRPVDEARTRPDSSDRTDRFGR